MPAARAYDAPASRFTSLAPCGSSNRNQPFPVIRVLIDQRADETNANRTELIIADPQGRIATKYAAQTGTVYVLRPDLHVCARWREGIAADVHRALRIAACSPEP